MRVPASTILRRLSRIRDDYSAPATERKLALLAELGRRRLPTAKDVHRLHEALTFLLAYPDDRRVRALAEAMLDGFARRTDLRRFSSHLADTGIEGTATHYTFFWHMALWLETTWPGCLSIDWDRFGRADDVRGLLYPLLPPCESAVLDETELPPAELLAWLKRPDESDAGFLLRRMSHAFGDDNGRETIYDDLDVSCVLSPGPGRPHRTGTRYRRSPVRFQARPLDRSRPDLARACMVAPLSVEAVSAREGRELIRMARAAMVTRSRDLYAFQSADERDVRLIAYEDGLQFAVIGVRPRSRLPIDTVYAMLTLKNGVPIGYVLTRSFFRSSEVAYNIFETFRGGESARIYGSVLAMTRYLFGADVFTIDPYQMGHDNPEAQESGAWWFYYKLGFRPLDPGVKRLVRAELARMRRHPGHRSTRDTLHRLSAANMFLFLGRERRDIRGLVSITGIGHAVSRRIAVRFGSDREGAMRVCEREAARRLGLGSLRGFSADERYVWRNWGPLLTALPGVERWPRESKRALVDVVRAKAGRRESDFLRCFDAHRELRRGLLRLAAEAQRGAAAGSS